MKLQAILFIALLLTRPILKFYTNLNYNTMKTQTLIILAGIILMPSFLFSQNNNNYYRDKIDSAFMELDQQFIVTGILLDKAIARY